MGVRLIMGVWVLVEVLMMMIRVTSSRMGMVKKRNIVYRDSWL